MYIQLVIGVYVQVVIGVYVQVVLAFVEVSLEHQIDALEDFKLVASLPVSPLFHLPAPTPTQSVICIYMYIDIYL